MGADFELSMGELRSVARFAADCAEVTLPEFEAAAPGDSRPRDAIDAARAFVAGAQRSNLQRTAAFGPIGRQKPSLARLLKLAALACGDAAAAAYLHPIAQATQVGHILRAAACAARVTSCEQVVRPKTSSTPLLTGRSHLCPRYSVDIRLRRPEHRVLPNS